ncbi:hypothetical protein PIB30_104834 [Stylosanthes scabra]|uniref:Uncharacterized protein n=1 Tax=Stylosanthes scabra TaxID=79078 RepID=A0ABU6RZ98_9FABA|nr:hypothetical protein [Stylosanthes scabra]
MAVMMRRKVSGSVAMGSPEGGWNEGECGFGDDVDDDSLEVGRKGKWWLEVVPMKDGGGVEVGLWFGGREWWLVRRRRRDGGLRWWWRLKKNEDVSGARRW